MKRGRLVNILLILFLAVVLFTPVGFHIKVWVNRIISFNPTPVEERKRQVLTSYNWNLIDARGNASNLDRSRGKVVFINLWASWCPPCVAEMPDLQELYQDYHKEVVFLFVARDEEAKVKAFMQKHQYNLPVFYENGSMPRQLESRSLPTTYIIDKNGSIVVAKTGTASWNSSATRSILDDLIRN